MARPIVEIDKTLTPQVNETYGTIEIRVVVMSRKWEPETKMGHVADEPLMDDDLDQQGTKSPLSSYLEHPKKGKQCVVFLINGQRHTGWDNDFIQRDLGFKYLKNRMMIIVTLDGLNQKPLAR